MAAADDLSDDAVVEQGEEGLLEVRFRDLFSRYYDSVLAFFVRRGRFTHHECEDLAQDTFLRVLRGRESFRGEITFRDWLFRIAANVGSSALERGMAAKRASPEVSLDDTQTVWYLPCPSDEDPLDHVLTEERLKRLHRALRELPEQMRTCVSLRLGSGLKYREIADAMEISIQTVKSHLAQARPKLRALLAGGPENTVEPETTMAAQIPAGRKGRERIPPDTPRTLPDVPRKPSRLNKMPVFRSLKY